MIMQLLPKQIFPGFLILYYYHRGTQNHFDTSSFQLPAFVVQPKHSDTRQRTAQNESYAWIDFQSSAATLLHRLCRRMPLSQLLRMRMPLSRSISFFQYSIICSSCIFHTAQILFQKMSEPELFKNDTYYARNFKSLLSHSSYPARHFKSLLSHSSYPTRHFKCLLSLSS